ncbi:MAG: hypothetical protein M3Z10_05585 [Gemmatimonadota bacterium]|nr:hypothetical protein [Gemmatimonadota bacterium]
MTAPFVSQLRARGDVLQLAAAGSHAITVRVEMPELWDTVRASVTPSSAVATLKAAALDALFPGEAADAFVMKLRGFEVLDENESLTQVGAVDGSIFLLTYRRRRPVR